MKRNRVLRISAVLTALLLAVSAAVWPLQTRAYAASGVTMGQAFRGEKGMKNNKPGDKNGKEVAVTSWQYSVFGSSLYHWQYVLRARDHALAREIAANMKAACSNNRIGYDQVYPDRTSFYDEAKKNNWDIAGIRKKCETTCTNAISVCLNAAGVKVPKNWMSEDVYDDLLETGKFIALDDKEYVASSDRLLPGDILVNPGRHTAMVVDSPNPFTYKLTYKDTGGKNRSVEIEEDKKVRLNLNNGNKIRVITMNKDRNLSSSVPEKDNYEFTGWEKTGTRAFAAQFKGARPAIATSSDKISVSGDDQ